MSTHNILCELLSIVFEYVHSIQYTMNFMQTCKDLYEYRKNPLCWTWLFQYNTGEESLKQLFMAAPDAVMEFIKNNSFTTITYIFTEFHYICSGKNLPTVSMEYKKNHLNCEIIGNIIYNAIKNWGVNLNVNAQNIYDPLLAKQRKPSSEWVHGCYIDITNNESEELLTIGESEYDHIVFLKGYNKPTNALYNIYIIEFESAK
jgi:hypothetical protein